MIQVVFPGGPASAGVPDRKADREAAAGAIDAFAIDVYRRLAEDDGERKGNLFFSPYSIASALAMTYGGASGQTAAEMAKALRFAGDAAALHASMKKIADRFGAISGDEGVIDVANRLWLDGTQKLLPDYIALAGENYDGGVESADFRKGTEDARATINAWVERKTRDKIRELLRKGDVTGDTRLVLTNAIYFNAAWREPFDAELTKEEPFRTGRNESKNVPMMQQTGMFSYGETPELQMIKVPYGFFPPRISLLVLLPRVNKSFTQLENLEKDLTLESLDRWTSDMRFRRAALWLPKFRVEGRFELKEVLKKLGMKLAFGRDADFSGMVADPHNEEGDFCIDAVIHQSFIDLDEKGTEAAAATAVSMIRATAFRPETEEPVEFRADHPFIYCIVDDQTGVILFMGRMMEP
jgi:serpin B